MRDFYFYMHATDSSRAVLIARPISRVLNAIPWMAAYGTVFGALKSSTFQCMGAARCSIFGRLYLGEFLISREPIAAR